MSTKMTQQSADSQSNLPDMRIVEPEEREMSDVSLHQVWKYQAPKEPTKFPLYLSSVAAGSPGPADDAVDCNLDLNELLVENPAATFFVKVHGDSMVDAGISSGDLLVVDRAKTPKEGTIVVASLNGELTVKRLHYENGRLQLVAENIHYPPIDVYEAAQFNVWGVVTHVIHKMDAMRSVTPQWMADPVEA